MNTQKVIEDIVNWLKNTVVDAGCNGIVLGLSGGIDSAVVAALAKKAFPENTLGVIMPCYSNPRDEEDAVLTAEAIGLKTVKVDLSSTYDELLKAVGASSQDNRMALANIKPRLRMTTLYYHAAMNNYLVAGTGNRSEFYVGYFTKYGDSGVDILPIVSFVKGEVRELAKALGIPHRVIDKAPSAGLWENQTDESEMGVTYDELDNYIKTGEADERVRKVVDSLHVKSEHKRRPILKFEM